MTNYSKSDPETIKEMFGNIAENYDRANGIMSFQLHKHWNKKLIQLVLNKATIHGEYLDLCSGTGEIALTFLKHSPSSQKITLLDFCKEMIEEAKQKFSQIPYPSEVSFIQGDAQSLPFANETFAYATMAYGIRNIQHPHLAIEEAFRVLKPGGLLAILELTQPTNPFLKFGHNIHLSTVLPLMGRLISSNKNAYQYLSQSIQDFVKPEILKEIFLKTGFQIANILPLTGGIATILFAKKMQIK